MGAAMAQVNVRMDAELKRAGDRALAEIGFSPSEAVRALWARAANRGRDAEALRRALRGETPEAPHVHDGDDMLDPEAQRKLALLEEHRRLMGQTMEQLGIRGKPLPENHPSDKELYIAAMEDRMRERGLM